MLHKDAVLGDSHFPHTWLYANAAARTGATGFLSTDVYKLALQVDTQALYILTAITPTWFAVGVSGGVVAESHTAAVWTAANTVLVEGAFGYETDTTKFKIGDGVTAWNSLAHWRYVPEHSVVTTTGGTTVLTTAQNKATSIQTTGVLVSNAIIVVANTMAPFVAENTNTGAFTTTFKTAAGTGVAIAQATHQMLYADGVNVETASSAGAGSGDVVGPASAVNLSIAQYSGTTGKLISDSGVAVSALEVVANKATSFGTVNNTLYPTVQAVKNYVDPLVVGLLDDRGSYDASVNTFPAAGGSGAAGAVLKGDLWYISVGGTLGSAVVKVGDSVRALVDAPGQTAGNWSVLETNIGFVPANVAGNLGQFAATTSLQLANTISDETGSGALVFANTPTLVTPALGAATATSINGATITSGTLNGSVTGTNTGDNTVATGLLSATTTVSVSAATAPTNGQVLTATAGTTATWQTPSAGAGDMVLASVQSVTGLKTFDTTKLAVKGSSTGTTAFSSANASATSYTYTMPAASMTLAGSDFAQSWSAIQTFGNGNLVLSGLTSGASTLKAPAIASAYVHTLPAATDTLVGLATTGTLTNKRTTARVGTVADSATPTINTDLYDIYTITALTTAITSMTTNLTGTPVEGDSLIIEITGTAARAITWGTSFEAATATLPSTTVGTEKLITGFLWNTTTSKWSCVANGVAPGTVYAALAGSASQAFAVATPAGANDATPRDFFAPITNALAADVSLNNTANYFDGPSVAQGSTGKWFVSGTVTFEDAVGSGGVAGCFIKLWDGTTVIAATGFTLIVGYRGSVSLSGIITSPAGNLRISVRDSSSTSGKIVFNATSTSKDSTLSAVRIG